MLLILICTRENLKAALPLILITEQMNIALSLLHIVTLQVSAFNIVPLASTFLGRTSFLVAPKSESAMLT